jgi:fructose-bisphosphate aldolase class II
VRKINIDTDIRLAMTGAIRATWPRTVQVRPARLPEAGPRSRQAGLQGPLPVLRLRRPGGKIKPVSLDKIAEKYKSGELAQIVQ